MNYSYYSNLIDYLNDSCEEYENTSYVSCSYMKHDEMDMHQGQYCWKIHLYQLLK